MSLSAKEAACSWTAVLPSPPLPLSDNLGLGLAAGSLLAQQGPNNPLHSEPIGFFLRNQSLPQALVSIP
jgi:hypothetical protein